MNYRNLRHLLETGASRLVLSIEGEGDTGGGGAPAPAPAAEPAAAPAAEGGGDPPAPAPAADAPAAAAGEVGEEPAAAKPARVPWQNKRIDQLTATAKAEKERADAAAAEAAETKRQLEAYRALYGSDAAPPAAPGATPPAAPAADAPMTAYTQEDVQREAQRIAGMHRLNDRCDAMFTAGKAAHGDGFVAACNAAGQAFGADLAGRVDFFEAITDLPNGADVYAQLAGDLDHFAEVLAMPPMKLGMELAKLSAAGSTKKAPVVSKVPAPIEPLEGSGGSDFNPDTASMDDYEKDFEARRARRAAAG